MEQKSAVETKLTKPNIRPSKEPNDSSRESHYSNYLTVSCAHEPIYTAAGCRRYTVPVRMLYLKPVVFRKRFFSFKAEECDALCTDWNNLEHAPPPNYSEKLHKIKLKNTQTIPVF